MKRLLILILLLIPSLCMAAGPIDWSKPYARMGVVTMGAGAAAACTTSGSGTLHNEGFDGASDCGDDAGGHTNCETGGYAFFVGGDGAIDPNAALSSALDNGCTNALGITYGATRTAGTYIKKDTGASGYAAGIALSFYIKFTSAVNGGDYTSIAQIWDSSNGAMCYLYVNPSGSTYNLVMGCAGTCTTWSASPIVIPNPTTTWNRIDMRLAGGGVAAFRIGATTSTCSGGTVSSGSARYWAVGMNTYAQSGAYQIDRIQVDEAGDAFVGD